MNEQLRTWAENLGWTVSVANQKRLTTFTKVAVNGTVFKLLVYCKEGSRVSICFSTIKSADGKTLVSKPMRGVMVHRQIIAWLKKWRKVGLDSELTTV